MEGGRLRVVHVPKTIDNDLDLPHGIPTFGFQTARHIGVDLVKPKPVLDAAYDDELGVTAAFNLNTLAHVNRLLGSDFVLRQWRHVAFFDAPASRIEMHLEARQALTVRWPGGERRFAAAERIHTENSCKYTVESFDALLRRAGYTQTRCWTDERGWFAVFAAS